MSDLLLEDWDDRAIGSKDIAEADRHELSLDILEDRTGSVLIGILFTQMCEELRDLICLSFFDLLIKGLNDHLAETLGSTHDIGRIDSLVRTDQDKTLASMCHRCIGSLEGSNGIVLDCLTRAVFHQRHMFVCSCMVDDLRLVLFKNLEHFPAVADRSDQNN